MQVCGCIHHLSKTYCRGGARSSTGYFWYVYENLFIGLTIQLVTLLALCDFVYAIDSATFQTPFPVLGQSPEACSSYLFPKIMGQAKANAMLLLNEKVHAKQVGAVNINYFAHANRLLNVG